MNTLELISAFEECKPDATIRINLGCGFYASTDFACDSWRGSYNLPATIVEMDTVYTVEEALTNLRQVYGMEVTGWKGGKFILGDYDEVFLVNDPRSVGDCTIVTNVHDYDSFVELTIQNDSY